MTNHIEMDLLAKPQHVKIRSFDILRFDNLEMPMEIKLKVLNMHETSFGYYLADHNQMIPAFWVIDKKSKNDITLKHLQIKEDCYGLSLAKFIINECMKSYKGFKLDCNKSDEHAYRFLKSLGFKDINNNNRYWVMQAPYHI